MADNEKQFSRIEQEIKRTKKVAKWGSISFIGLIIILFVYGCGKFFSILDEPMEKSIFVDESPNKVNQVHIKDVRHSFPASSFNHPSIYIYYGRKGENLKESKHYYDYYGDEEAVPSEDEFKVKWIDDDHVIIFEKGQNNQIEIEM